MDAATEIFKTIKPKCVLLAQLTFSEDSLSESSKLLNALKDLDKTLDEEVNSCLKKSNELQFFIPVNLADYIMVPLTNLFKKESLSDSELEHVLSIISILLKYSWCQPGVLSMELFTQYMTLITFLIGGKPGHFSIHSHSDETFTNGIVCIRELLNGCINQDYSFIENVLTNSKFIPTLGYLVSLLLSIAVDSKIMKIKVQALQTLNALYHLLDNGEVLSLFFPGSISSIAKIVNSKPHSTVLSESFNTLTTLVLKVFSDFDLEITVENKITSLDSLKQNSDDINTENFDVSLFTIVIPESESFKSKHRTSAWLKTTLPQFEKALQIILNIDFSRYDKHSVYESIFQFLVKTIRNCLLSCYPLVPMLLKSLSVICANDVSFTPLAIDSLIYISEIDNLKAILNNCFNDELRVMRYNFTSPDPMKAKNMTQFLNLLVCVLINLDSLSSSTFKMLIQNLAETMAFLVEIKSKVDSKKKISTTSTINDSMEKQLLLVSSSYTLTSFSSIENVSLFSGIFIKETETELENLFVILGSYIQKLENFDISMFFSNGIDSLSYIHRAVLSWILSSISKNIHISGDNHDHDIVDDFLQFSTEDEVDVSHSNRSISKDVQLNIAYSSLEICTDVLKHHSNNIDSTFDVKESSLMSLRVIDNNVKVLGAEIEYELIDILYPVIECLASSNEDIRIESQLVVLNIAKLLYGGSVEKLLSENTDYLVDSLSFNLVDDALTPKVPIILAVLVKIGSMNIISELDDIIQTIFTLLDMYHGYNSLVEGFFLVFDVILSKIYDDLHNYSFEQLEKNCEEENVNTFGMWGLTSMQEVEEFVSKKAVSIDDMSDSDDDTDDSVDEPLRKSKILEINSDDSDDENDTMSIPSKINDEEEESDDDKWISPLNLKLYNTVFNILSYTERLVQSQSISLTITLLKIIKRIIPLLATQKSKFLPIGANLWGVVTSILNNTEDLRIVLCCIDILKELIRYGNTFFTIRFIELFKVTKKNMILEKILTKQVSMLINKHSVQNNSPDDVVINRSSTSTNWERNTFLKVCDLFIFSLVKFGRFIPNDVALSIMDITIYYEMDPTHYGYFDDLAHFVLKYKKLD